MTKKLFKPANPDSIVDNEVGYMTYLDLLTELQSLDEDKLLEVVTVYDTLDDVFLPVGRIVTKGNDERIGNTCLEV
tara:strand:- start:2099 stop:2326 length:228 start_codon:yes stop_codon:yes gene_type:complete